MTPRIALTLAYDLAKAVLLVIAVFILSAAIIIIIY
jgi:hypothetical protein